jgi:hypothetical protein
MNNHPNAITARPGELWVFAAGAVDGKPCLADGLPRGPFTSVADVREFIREETVQYLNTETLVQGRNEDYGSRFVVLQVLDVIRPVPVCSVTIDLVLVMNKD